MHNTQHAAENPSAGVNRLSTPLSQRDKPNSLPIHNAPVRSRHRQRTTVPMSPEGKGRLNTPFSRSHKPFRTVPNHNRPGPSGSTAVSVLGYGSAGGVTPQTPPSNQRNPVGPAMPNHIAPSASSQIERMDSCFQPAAGQT